jgi:tetratricopeptide (TPR) repeat protein
VRKRRGKFSRAAARGLRRLLMGLTLCAAGPFAVTTGQAAAAGLPYVPASDSVVLTEVPAGATHRSTPSLALTATRLDVALPLAEFDISRARATGDLRFLGYAEAALAPWRDRPDARPEVLVLDATILQSRHAFDASLLELDRALGLRPDDAQGWLTRAVVLRVLGRYQEAASSCERLRASADPAITSLCVQSLRSLTGHLGDAYLAIKSLSTEQLPAEARAWRYSELGEMSERLGDSDSGGHWFREGLAVAPGDLYLRTAYADWLLQQGRANETVGLLADYQSMEPMLLRLTIAHRMLRDGAGTGAEAQLATAFQLELARGDAVHRREQARFLLDVEHDPGAALSAAVENWRVQREPDDISILLRAAQASHRPDAAAPALEFLKRTGLEDVRLAAYRGAN